MNSTNVGGETEAYISRYNGHPATGLAIKLAPGANALATTLCVLGVLLWLVYGLAIVDGPLIGSSIVTFAMTFIILVMKIRYG